MGRSRFQPGHTPLGILRTRRFISTSCFYQSERYTYRYIDDSSRSCDEQSYQRFDHLTGLVERERESSTGYLHLLGIQSIPQCRRTDTIRIFSVIEQLLHSTSSTCSSKCLLFCLLWACSTFLLVIERSCKYLSRQIDDMQRHSNTTCEQWNPPSCTSAFNVSS